MSNKKSFIVYNDWRGSFDKLPDEIAGRLIKALFAHANGEDVDDSDYAIVAIMEQFKATMKRDSEKWATQLEQRSNAGKKSAEMRKQKALESNDRSTTVEIRERKATDSVSVSVSDSVINKNTNDPFVFSSENNQKLLSILNKTVDRKYRSVSDKTVGHIKARIKEGFSYKDIREAITNCSKDDYHTESGYKYLTLEFITRPDQLDKWLNAKGPVVKKLTPADLGAPAFNVTFEEKYETN